MIGSSLGSSGWLIGFTGSLAHWLPSLYYKLCTHAYTRHVLIGGVGPRVYIISNRG